MDEKRAPGNWNVLEEHREERVKKSDVISCLWSPGFTSELQVPQTGLNYRPRSWECIKKLPLRTQTGHCVVQRWGRSEKYCKNSENWTAIGATDHRGWNVCAGHNQANRTGK